MIGSVFQRAVNSPKKRATLLAGGLVAALALGDDGAELGHAVAQPPGNPATMKRKIGAACSLNHGSL